MIRRCSNTAAPEMLRTVKPLSTQPILYVSSQMRMLRALKKTGLDFSKVWHSRPGAPNDWVGFWPRIRHKSSFFPSSMVDCLGWCCAWYANSSCHDGPTGGDVPLKLTGNSVAGTDEVTPPTPWLVWLFMNNHHKNILFSTRTGF